MEPIFTREELDGCWLGRVWDDVLDGPIVVTQRDGVLIDITTRGLATVAQVCALAEPAAYVDDVPGRAIGPVDGPHRWLAPCDLQVIKACGVTFAKSMVERVIEEKAAGDPALAAAVRTQVQLAIGGTLATLVPGSDAAAGVKAALKAAGLWSQYLEVGIGPDAEVFTKAPVLSAVGHGADVGIHPASEWNNPEPEVVLAIAPDGRIVGATLGNDVNLRDIEGRSALLLGKAKDNNASAAIGPMIRLFDGDFTLDNVRRAELTLSVTGTDGFHLTGRSSMAEISRDPEFLAAQAIGRHHQYPDGLMLYLGTMFAPVQDRDGPGQGFTHHIGDMVTISAPGLGRLTNRVVLSTEAPEWTFGLSDLFDYLARRAF